ncbi:MAG: IS1634 family transposase [Micrococcaceae bacterium]|nr:IS1634 family transposase [Micrococcaceae bacterium]
MSPFLRKVTTASGATAVQIVSKIRGQRKILEHLGSAHSEQEIAALVAVGHQKIEAASGTQQLLDLGLETSEVAVSVEAKKKVTGSASQLLVDAIRACYDQLGLSDQVADEAFFQMVLARLVEPTSKRDSLRVLTELGVNTVHRNTFFNALKRAQDRDYRGKIGQACFDYSLHTTGMSLLLYDVTTLYFEAEHEDEYRKVGYSKERRVDPQIVVGLLVDRAGFPLDVHSFEGNTAETHTILPVLEAFQQRHQVADMVVVADAGMLSEKNLQAIDEANLRFIVGSKQTKAPKDLAKQFHFHPTNDTVDGTLVDTVTTRGRYQPDPKRFETKQEPVWDPATHPDHRTRYWRAVWQYRQKRATRDLVTLEKQREKALRIVAGQQAVKSARFVKTKGTTRVFDQTTFTRAANLVGWKGYVTNLEANIMDGAEIVASYHQLWHVEQSFRMSKTDLRARPMFHHTRQAIEAHLTVVFTALAVARYMQTKTGVSLKQIITTLKPLQEFTGQLGDHEITFPPEIPDQAQHILDRLHPET